jgi:hypothetical protein
VPTPEEELILLLCGTTERRERTAGRIEELAGRADYEALAALMARQLLFPLLGSRLLALAPEPAPSHFRELLREATEAARRRGAVVEMLATQLYTDLAEAEIPALPLKGASLSRDLYGDPGMRLAKDIDILVDPAQLEAAAGVLARRGYRVCADEAAGGELPRLHISLEHGGGEMPPVEVHWRIHWYEERFSQRMLERSRPGAAGIRRAEPADELASLLLFFSRDGLTGLRLGTDVAAWWDLYGGSEPLLDRVAREAPELRVALSAASSALERLLGTPASAMLSPAERSRSRRSTTAIRLANWTVTGDWDQINANLSLVDLLLLPRGGVRAFLRRSLLPPPAEVAGMYRLPGSSVWRLRFWRLVHGPKLAVRYLIALWRIRGGRDWVALPESSRGGTAS